MNKIQIPSTVNQYILTYFVFVLMFYGIHYTADWANYAAMVKQPNLCPDYLFRYIARIVGKDIDFAVIYKLHIVFMGGGNPIAD